MYRDWQQLMLPGMDLDQFLSIAEKFGATNMMKASSTAVLFLLRQGFVPLLCARTLPVSWLARGAAQTTAAWQTQFLEAARELCWPRKMGVQEVAQERQPQ